MAQRGPYAYLSDKNNPTRTQRIQIHTILPYFQLTTERNTLLQLPWTIHHLSNAMIMNFLPSYSPSRTTCSCQPSPVTISGACAQTYTSLCHPINKGIFQYAAFICPWQRGTFRKRLVSARVMVTLIIVHVILIIIAITTIRTCYSGYSWSYLNCMFRWFSGNPVRRRVRIPPP
jgi:hypothetical protein